MKANKTRFNPCKPALRRPLLFAVLLLCGLHGLCGTGRADIDVHEETKGKLIGTYDFYYYYCAVKLLAHGENPYDRRRINEVCASDKTADAPPSLALVYPPWTLVLLYPLKDLPFRGAAALWYVLNIVFAAGAAVLAARAGSRLPLLFPLVAALGLPPVHETLEWGQISLFVAFGAALALWGIEKRRDALAGLGLAVAAIKYHLLFLWGVYLLIWLIKERRTSVLIWAGVYVALFSLAAHALSPGVFADWMAASAFVMQHGQSNQTANLLGLMRSVLGGLSPAADRAAMVLSPALAAGLMLGIFFKRGLPTLETGTAVLLCLSVAFAPYAWFHDSSLLLITVVIMLSQLHQRGVSDRRLLMLYLPAVLGLNLFTVAAAMLLLRYQSDLFWYPFAVLALYLWTARRDPQSGPAEL